MTTEIDAYKDIADLYMSLVSPALVKAKDLDDPVISKWLVDNLPADAKILDAGCGLGFETIILHKGLPSKDGKKRFRAYGSDLSQSMIDAAIINGENAGLDRSRFRQASFAQLANVDNEWKDFDVVMVSYGVYTFPENISINEYDAYFQECCSGLANVLRHGGHLIINVRDWEKLISGDRSTHSSEVQHGETIYRCHYSWTLNNNGHHQATLNMSSSSGRKQTTTINFAQRTPEQLIKIAETCGLKPVFRGHQGDATEAYHVIAMQKI